jgi:hypothetical protein
MTAETGIAPLHRNDVQALYDARDETSIEALEDCLSILGDLFRRYTGSMFDVQFMDEGLALRVFHESLQPLRDAEPHWQRMTSNLQTYLALKARAESDGLTAPVRASAVAAVDALSEQWALVAQYPALSRTAEFLVQPDLQTAVR